MTSGRAASPTATSSAIARDAVATVVWWLRLVAIEGDRFFRPPYVGGRGWVGVRLDREIDWQEIAAICVDAYRVVAPKKMLAALDAADI